MSTKISDSIIEYQVNGITDGSWTQGVEVTNLNINDIVYARLVGQNEIENKTIKDTIKPEEFEMTVSNITSEGLTMSGVSLDKESGIKNYTYIVKNKEGEEVTHENVTQSTYTVTGLDSYTEYTVYMLANDFGGNVQKSNEKNIKTMDIFNETEQVIEGESLIACIEENELRSGYYLIKVNGQEYSAEIYNFDDDITYTENTNLGKTEADTRMVICKYNGNMTVNSGVRLTTTSPKKGLFIYVAKTLANNGEISMSGKGANAPGQNVYLWKKSDGNYEYVPKVGAAGAGGQSVKNIQGSTASKRLPGTAGNDGTNRSTGGGAGGSLYVNNLSSVWVYVSATSGSGSAGTSYSGGVGGESISQSYNSNGSGTITGKSGQVNGGNSAGGLLIIKCNVLENTNGKITANSLISGNGGGTVNIFINNSIKEGIIEANGLGLGGKGTYAINTIN